MSSLQGRSVWYHIIYCDFKVFVDTQGAHSGPQCRHHDCRAGHHYNQHFPRCSWWPVSTVSVSHKRAATENSMQGRTETSITWCLWLCSLIRAIKALKSRILSHLPFCGCDLDWSWTFWGLWRKQKNNNYLPGWLNSGTCLSHAHTTTPNWVELWYALHYYLLAL